MSSHLDSDALGGGGGGDYLDYLATGGV
jgi:hypothetical protein